MFLPWQQQQWQHIRQAQQTSRLPHALLFSGMPGIGKQMFAENIIRAAGCKQMNASCQCHHCHQIMNKVHPDVALITPEKAGGMIKVDQIREVNTFISQSGLQRGWRFVVIYPAHHMNVSAANALLKTLEEPAAGATLILISDQAGRMPATVTSRCQRLVFAKPSTELALSWLAQQLPKGEWDASLLLRLAQGAPLQALAFTQSDYLMERKNVLSALQAVAQGEMDPLKAAVSVQAIPCESLVNLALVWIMDVLRLQWQGEAFVVNTDYLVSLKKLSGLPMQTMIGFMNFLQALYKEITSGINLNKQMLMENIFIHCRNLQLKKSRQNYVSR